jgi:hypothetical protein
VPAQFSRDYVDVKGKRKENARLVEIQGADHFALIDPQSKAWVQVEQTVMEFAA